jgi:hypothetical protein
MRNEMLKMGYVDRQESVEFSGISEPTMMSDSDIPMFR